MTLLFTHEACLDHDTGPHHPERPHRLAAILKALKGDAFAALEWRAAPEIDPKLIERVHPARHVDHVLGAIPAQGLGMLDGDTVVSAGSREAALRAAGAVTAAVDAVLAGGTSKTAFCAVRPPGHHAEPMRAMGFCLFNNIAIGALHARVAHKLKRIAVVDFDVHHGNGTQAAFESDPGLFYASTHQSPLYPGTGSASERGVADNIVNAPLPPLAGSREFRQAIRDVVLPALDRFAPELVMISAGFDAHRDDPLANLSLVEDDYAWVTGELMAVADKSAKGRVISTLEGGYNLAALAASTASHVGMLMRG
ncbi:MAG: histone deacetylase family protein [Alphaproteobacteria bacterium]